MSEESKKYNGWANYETWCVHLWLTNDEGSYRYWSEEAERQSKEACRCEEVRRGTWTVAEARRFRLADQLKSELEEASPIEAASLFTDLLSSALSEVDWHEVADAFLEELEPEEEEDDQGDGLPFPLGQVVCTPGVLAAVSTEEIDAALSRHVAGDWGEMPEGERLENETAVREGHQIHSVYRGKGGCRFYVITEADRSSTSVLLPSEY